MGRRKRSGRSHCLLNGRLDGSRITRDCHRLEKRSACRFARAAAFLLHYFCWRHLQFLGLHFNAVLLKVRSSILLQPPAFGALGTVAFVKFGLG